MRKTLSSTLAALALSIASAAAQEPIGDWLVNDKVATIRIENCGGKLWGVVAWEKAPGVDANNPDPAKRRRPTLGMPVLLAMQPTDGKQWEGNVYNSRDGKTYSVTISLSSPNVLRIEGCLLGFLCGGENWTRVKADVQTSAPKTGKPGSGADANAPKSICPSVAADANGSMSGSKQRR